MIDPLFKPTRGNMFFLKTQMEDRSPSQTHRFEYIYIYIYSEKPPNGSHFSFRVQKIFLATEERTKINIDGKPGDFFLKPASLVSQQRPLRDRRKAMAGNHQELRISKTIFATGEKKRKQFNKTKQRALVMSSTAMHPKM